jgi:hypothetical protein
MRTTFLSSVKYPNSKDLRITLWDASMMPFPCSRCDDNGSEMIIRLWYSDEWLFGTHTAMCDSDTSNEWHSSVVKAKGTKFLRDRWTYSCEVWDKHFVQSRPAPWSHPCDPGRKPYLQTLSPSFPNRHPRASMGKAHAMPEAAGLSFPRAWRSGQGGVLHGGRASS